MAVETREGPAVAPDREALLALYRVMLTIRLTEEGLARLHQQGTRDFTVAPGRRDDQDTFVFDAIVVSGHRRSAPQETPRVCRLRRRSPPARR